MTLILHEVIYHLKGGLGLEIPALIKTVRFSSESQAGEAPVRGRARCVCLCVFTQRDALPQAPRDPCSVTHTQTHQSAQVYSPTCPPDPPHRNQSSVGTRN